MKKTRERKCQKGGTMITEQLSAQEEHEVRVTEGSLYMKC